jgi:general nucleoside transport system permease protein
MSATSAAPRAHWTSRRTGRLPRGARRVGMIGMLFGLLACWVPLPPISARTPLPSVALAIVAIAAGIWAVTRGEHRVGWGAVVTALAGVAAGFLASRSSLDNLDYVFAWSSLAAATLRFATPLTFAAIGGMFSERSGVVNIGLEGMMLMGAFFAAWGADRTGSWSLGLLIGMASGGLLALVHAVFSINVRADQIVSGTAINFLALGITGYLYIDLFGEQGTPADLPEIPNVHLPAIEDVFFIGDIFGELNLMIWLSFALIVVSWLVMFKTPLGLRIRSVGEHPRAADTVGISVYGVRYAAVITSGILAAAGGAYISIGFVHSFTENITAGRGFIALAALIFGMWRPFGAFAAALLFGFSTALAQRLTVYSESAATLFETLPYVLTLIAVAGVIGRSIPPAAIGRPYVKQ